ncbi:hypothetical protein GDO78_018196 [Eleutherodactylus coqui]|uniref:Uncharacterized protein n=1 Tax=Eleutherodactylus coqui TaxID=57060 RepID=A0A8J6E5V5_ELECQ|nr:hypothetical protein GDO78_018196 [Eleutherodactylus coqui]
MSPKTEEPHLGHLWKSAALLGTCRMTASCGNERTVLQSPDMPSGACIDLCCKEGQAGSSVPGVPHQQLLGASNAVIRRSSQRTVSLPH